MYALHLNHITTTFTLYEKINRKTIYFNLRTFQEDLKTIFAITYISHA